MIYFALALTAQIDLSACEKYDGDMPTKCEMALADGMFRTGEALKVCAAMHQSAEEEAKRLEALLLSVPAKEPEGFSLFSIRVPTWVGVAAGTAIAAGACTASAFVKDRAASVGLCGAGAGLGGVVFGLSF